MTVEQKVDKIIARWKEDGWEFIWGKNGKWSAGRATDFAGYQVFHFTDKGCREALIAELRANPRAHRDTLRNRRLSAFKRWFEGHLLEKLTGYHPVMSCYPNSKILRFWKRIWQKI